MKQMKKTFLTIIACAAIFSIYSCVDYDLEGVNFRKEMRNFVINISKYARKTNPNFIVIPQNGQEVGWDKDEYIGVRNPDADYLNAINGCGREDTYFGVNSNYEGTYGATPASMSRYFLDICDPYVAGGKTILSIDYCQNANYIKSSYGKYSSGYISFAAPERNLTIIPEQSSKYSSLAAYYPYNENSNDIESLSQAKNFLYILNTENFSSTEKFLSALEKTNYDVIVMDACNNDGKFYTKSQIDRIQYKKNGGKRLVIAYMSIGECEDYRWYWDSSWLTVFKTKSLSAPKWLCDVNPDWVGNYKVKYWMKDWQKIIYGNDSSYTKKILNAGFDGVYLDIIDAYQYFEEM